MFEIHLFLHSVNINTIQGMLIFRENMVSCLCSSKNLNICYEYNSADILNNNIPEEQIPKGLGLQLVTISFHPLPHVHFDPVSFFFPMLQHCDWFPYPPWEQDTADATTHIYWCLHMFPTFFLNCLMLEDGPSLLSWNLSNQSPTRTIRHVTRAKTSAVLQCKPEIWHRTLLVHI